MVDQAFFDEIERLSLMVYRTGATMGIPAEAITTLIATVAKMAGTSIAMIEKVYGHFRTEHLRQAQQLLDKARRKRAS